MNKKKKTLLVVAVCCFVIGVAIGLYFALNSHTSTQISFQQLCGTETGGEFMVATISRRSGTEGQVSDLLELTSEDQESLMSDVVAIMNTYSFETTKDKPSSEDFISLSVVYSEALALRLECYRDGTVLVIGGESGGIYRNVPQQQGGACIYDRLYTYFTGEAPV